MTSWQIVGLASKCSGFLRPEDLWDTFPKVSCAWLRGRNLNPNTTASAAEAKAWPSTPPLKDI